VDRGTLQIVVGDAAGVRVIAEHLATSEVTGSGGLRDGLAICYGRLPAAATVNPDANLAIIGHFSSIEIADQVEQVEAHCYPVRHRLTLGRSGTYTFGEAGDVRANARDVLRADGIVLVEGATVVKDADDRDFAMTAAELLHMLDMPAWSECIGELCIFVAVDIQPGWDVPALVAAAEKLVRANGGPAAPIHLALVGVEHVIPEYAGQDALLRVDTALGGLIERLDKFGEVLLLGTSAATMIDLR
jgi:hypothetical protein